MKLELLKNTQISNFVKTRSMVIEMFLVEGQIDERQT